MSDDKEPKVSAYLIWLCDLCVQGKGGICHVPGCALIRCKAPGLALDTENEVRLIPQDEVERIADLCERARR